MTNLCLSPDEGLGLHVKTQVKSGRQWFVAVPHISLPLLRSLFSKTHTHNIHTHSYAVGAIFRLWGKGTWKWRITRSLWVEPLNHFPPKWRVYVSILIESAMITSHSLVIVIPPSLPSLSSVWYSSWAVLCSQARLLPRQAPDAHRAPDSISDNENIRASRGENASMPTDFIYLRSVKARIRGRDKVNHVIYFYGAVFMHTQEREEMSEQERGSVGGRCRQIVSYEFHIKVLSFRACTVPNRRHPAFSCVIC